MRVILIILDSAGIGELPDAADYGDAGSNTLINIKKQRSDMILTNMLKIGLGDIEGGELLKSGGAPVLPTGAYGRLMEVSKGKDTTTGHWEIAGLHIDQPFPTYPNGFPKDLVEKFEEISRRKTLGNCTASGTEIIQRLGDEHVQTGSLILYTSADSVFQIAAHEDVVPLDELYRICEEARAMLVGDHAVSRVIARPFTGTSGNYERTRNRKDFSLKPFGKTMLDYLKDNGMSVAAVGKIEDIFTSQGITDAVHTQNNMDGVDKTLDYMDTIDSGLIFTNLVDFDMLYGHRNNVDGYADALMAFDARLPEIMSKLKDDDILMLSADHGCDPTMTQSTDHSREYIPLLVYGKKIRPGANLHTRTSFADIAATIMAYLNINPEGKVQGTSFLKDILK